MEHEWKYDIEEDLILTSEMRKKCEIYLDRLVDPFDMKDEKIVKEFTVRALMFHDNDAIKASNEYNRIHLRAHYAMKDLTAAYHSWIPIEERKKSMLWAMVKYVGKSQARFEYTDTIYKVTVRQMYKIINEEWINPIYNYTDSLYDNLGTC